MTYKNHRIYFTQEVSASHKNSVWSIDRRPSEDPVVELLHGFRTLAEAKDYIRENLAVEPEKKLTMRDFDFEMSCIKFSFSVAKVTALFKKKHKDAGDVEIMQFHDALEEALFEADSAFPCEEIVLSEVTGADCIFDRAVIGFEKGPSIKAIKDRAFFLLSKAAQMAMEKEESWQ